VNDDARSDLRLELDCHDLGKYLNNAKYISMKCCRLSSFLCLLEHAPVNGEGGLHGPWIL
jgi:hypothetical protein